MAITTAKLTAVYDELLPQGFSEGSALAAAGTSSVDYNTNQFTRVTVGAPSNVDEGGIKPIKDPTINRFQIMDVKLAGILPISDEAADTAEGSALINRSVAEFVAKFIPSVDISVLAGTDPATGLDIARYEDVNLRDNAVQVRSAGAASVDEAFNLARYGNKSRGARFLLSDEGIAQLSAMDSAQGYQKYPSVDLPTPTFRGKSLVTRHSVGLNGFTAAGDDIENDVLGYYGPFQNIKLAFRPISVKISDTASAGGFNAFENNYTLYRIEQRFKFFIDGAGNWTVVRDKVAA